MKMKHGWPRKQTQYNLDKRIGNQFRAEHRKRSNAFLNELGVNLGQADIDVSDEDGEPAEEVARPRRSGAKKDYSRLFDPYTTTSPSKQAKSLMVMLKVRANITLNKHNDEQNILDTPLTTPKATKLEPAEQPDYHILAEAEQYLAELELNKRATPPYLTSPYSPVAAPTQSSPQELINTLRDLLQDQLRVNTLITPERSGTIRPIYHALAQRADSIASAQASLPTTPHATSTTSRSSISPPPNAPNFGVPFTFSGPRTTPFEWELHGQQQRKRRRIRQDREFKSSPLMIKPQPTAIHKSSPMVTKSSPMVKTGIKLVLKMTPAKQEVVEEPPYSDAEVDAGADTTMDDEYDPDETVPVIVGYYGQRLD